MSDSEGLERYERETAEERQRTQASLAALLPRLEGLGVTSVVMAYDGYGDEGALESPAAFAGETEIDLPADLAQELVALAQVLLPQNWEDNAGAFGELELDVTQRRLVRDHNWRVEDVAWETEEYPL